MRSHWVVRGKRSGPHPRALRIKHAPRDAEEHPVPLEPYRGPATQEEWIAQLHADPEFRQWQREARSAELGMLMARVHTPQEATE